MRKLRTLSITRMCDYFEIQCAVVFWYFSFASTGRGVVECDAESADTDCAAVQRP